MVMSRFSRRERSAGIRQSVTLGSGTWTVPYGKTVIKITARGGTGSAASGGAYWYDYSSYSAAYTDPPVQTAAAYTDPPVVTTAAYSDPPVLVTPESYSPGPYVNTYVFQDKYSSQQMYDGGYEYYQTTTSCPSPTYVYKFDMYTSYYCEDNYGPSTYNPAVYSPGAYHPAVYGPGPYHPATYGPGPYHPAVYYAGYTVYYPYYPATTGAATTIANTTVGTLSFPGGYATTGPVSSQTIYNQPAGAALTITVPSGGYVTIDTL